MTGSVVVVGAINVDLVVSGALPAPGQTVTGGVFAQHHGGKGGNQAVAASRALGGQGVVLVGAVGNDALGHDALEALRAEGVATSVAMRPGVPTGVALTAWVPTARTRSPWRRARTRSSPPRRDLRVRAGARDGSCSRAWRCRRRRFERRRHGAASTRRRRSEPRACAAVGRRCGVARHLRHAERARAGGHGRTPHGVVVVETRGPGRADHPAGRPETRVEAPKVDAVDTTGAGDCFNGVFAAGLAERMDVVDAAERATAAAASRSRRSAPARDADAADARFVPPRPVMPTFRWSGYGADVSEDRRASA